MRVLRCLHREGVALSDMALLYRSNAQSRILEHTLFRAGIFRLCKFNGKSCQPASGSSFSPSGPG